MSNELRILLPEFRSLRQQKLFARLVGLWMTYTELIYRDIDTESVIRQTALSEVKREAKEQYFKVEWLDAKTYLELKQLYLEAK